MEGFPSEVNRGNLEELLAEDATLVDYFNTFLSLPCFPERIFYNKDLDLLEQFSQRLVKDENDNVQISSRPPTHQQQRKHDSQYNTVHISYCVTTLDRSCGFEWLKKYRLKEFLKSRLYAEYKLSKILAAAQALYIEAIKTDIQRASNVKSLSKTLGSASSIQEIGVHHKQEKSLDSEPSDCDIVLNSDNESFSNQSIISSVHLTESVNENIGNPGKADGMCSSYNTSSLHQNIKENAAGLGYKDVKLKRDLTEIKPEKYINGVHSSANNRNIELAIARPPACCFFNESKASAAVQKSNVGPDLKESLGEKSNFKISDVERLSSPTKSSNRSLDLTEERSSKISVESLANLDVTDFDNYSFDITLGDVAQRDVTQRDIVPRDVTPKDVTSFDVIPRDVTPRDVTPRNVTPEDVLPGDVTPRDITRGDVTPKNFREVHIAESRETNRVVIDGYGNSNEMRGDHAQNDLRTDDVTRDDVVIRDVVGSCCDTSLTPCSGKQGESLCESFRSVQYFGSDADKDTREVHLRGTGVPTVDMEGDNNTNHIRCLSRVSEVKDMNESEQGKEEPSRDIGVPVDGMIECHVEVMNNEIAQDNLVKEDVIKEREKEKDWSEMGSVTVMEKEMPHLPVSSVTRSEILESRVGIADWENNSSKRVYDDESASDCEDVGGSVDENGSENDFKITSHSKDENEHVESFKALTEDDASNDCEDSSHSKTVTEDGESNSCDGSGSCKAIIGNDVDITMRPESKFDVQPGKSNQSDLRVSDAGGLTLTDITTDNESEKNFSDVSSWKRVGSQNSVSSDDVSMENNIDENSRNGQEGLVDCHVDLSTKAGMDRLKGFLANTKGESLLLFWLHVELWKHEEDEEEKARIIVDVKDLFLKNGSRWELPGEIRRHAHFLVQDLGEAQKLIVQPLHSYWCPRFTLHQLKNEQQKRGNTSNFPYTIRKAWPDHSDLVPRCDVPGHPYSSADSHDLTPHHPCFQDISRPHSSIPCEMRVTERKAHARSKSAQPRIRTTPCHTNAGEKQLELYAAPPPIQYGFQKRPVEAFPPPNEQEYLSPVRLIINPLAKPRPHTACSQSSNGESHHPSRAGSENSQETVPRHSLVDALTYDGETGCFFKAFITKQNNKLWLNCLSFWQALMDYSTCFDGHTFNPALVAKKAQRIYARFIASGSPCDVQLDQNKQVEVRRMLEPAYEELFDVVEEHVLACLKEPWNILWLDEQKEYDLVPKQDTVRYLEVNLKRTRRLIKSSGSLEEFQSYTGEKKDGGQFSIEEVNHPLPVSKDGVTFESIIKDRAELEGFQKFLEKRDPKGVMDLMVWTDMETFQRIPKTMEEKRNKKAKEIRHGYLNSKYFFGSDSPATKEAQNLILSMNGSSRIKAKLSSSLISECQKYVRCRIERKWLVLYKESQEYKDRQNPKQSISEVVEDIMLRRRLQRSEAAWRVLNSRWVSSSRDIVALRQTLNNPESCLVFRKFVALKGDTYENDVLFWIEVQKYKDLCHRHASEQCIKKKVQAITDCFITSSIPPELQIDVPIEMAEKLMEKITSRNPNIGPYLFREVQMTVFRVLFNLWKEFSSFRSTINEESILDVLDRKLQQHRVEVRMKREASEKKKLAKQETEKKKKEKEDKERKDLRSMEQLMSLMTESAAWEHDDEDVVLWRYSKHLAAAETPKKKVSTPAETTTSLVELTNQRSMITKSTNYITNSLKSERRAGKEQSVSKSSKIVTDRGSVVADSFYSNQTRRSRKDKISRNLTVRKIKRRPESKASEVIDRKSVEKIKTNLSENKKNEKMVRTALLKQRKRKESRNVLDGKISCVISQETFENIAEVKNLNRDVTRMKKPGVNDPGMKEALVSDSPVRNDGNSTRGARSDIMSMGSERAGSLRTSVLRLQWNESRGRNRSPVPLTSELLKDFTNSPEGAPLDIPLPLARISKPQTVSRDQTSIEQETKDKTFKREWNRINRISSRQRLRMMHNEMDVVPDVIVN